MTSFERARLRHAVRQALKPILTALVLMAGLTGWFITLALLERLS